MARTEWRDLSKPGKSLLFIGRSLARARTSKLRNKSDPIINAHVFRCSREQIRQYFTAIERAIACISPVQNTGTQKDKLHLSKRVQSCQLANHHPKCSSILVLPYRLWLLLAMAADHATQASTLPLCAKLGRKDVLEGDGIGGKFGNTLAQLLDRHLVLVEVEAEQRLVVDVRLLLDV
jgi:hypothetical protein